MLQIMLTLTAFMVLVIPMGHYLYHIAVGQKTFADPVFDPVDRLIYKLCGLKGEDMGWKKYGLSLLMANAVMVLIGYAVLRLQGILFFNPNGIGAMLSPPPSGSVHRRQFLRHPIVLPSSTSQDRNALCPPAASQFFLLPEELPCEF